MANNQLTIALITDTLHGEGGYEKALWEGATLAAQERGVTLLTFAVGFIEPDGPGRYKMNRFLQLAQSSEIDAYIFNTTIVCKKLDLASTEALFRSYAPRPVVSVATEVPGAAFIGVDNEKGMRSMVTHLVDVLKARRVAYISGPLSNPEAAARHKAYRDVVSRGGNAVDEKLIVEGEWTTVSGAQCIDRFVKNGVQFDAVACANDQMAIGAMAELFRKGKPVPNDVFVTGFDDISEASFCSPKLSTVFQPVPELGRQGLHHLVDVLMGKTTLQKVLIPAEVVLRSSAPASLVESAETGDSGRAAGGGGSVSDLFRQMHEVVRSIATDWTGKLFVDLETAYTSQSYFPEKDLVQQIHKASMQQLITVESAVKAAWSVIERSSVDASIVMKVSELLRALDTVVQEHRVALFFNQIRDSQNLVGALVNTNRALNSSTSLDNLESAISSTFPRTGIQCCYVVLFENSIQQEKAKITACLRSDESVTTLSKNETFDASRLLPHGVDAQGVNKAIVVPMVFEGQELGYAIYAVGSTESYVYETLTDQIASVIHNLLLIQRIARDEAQAAEKAAHIRELVLPMIRTIQESGTLAKDQSVALENLLQANTQTSQQLSVSEKLVKGMQEYLEKVIELTGSIDELSETINVISINAAIAAAKGGAEGKVFTVIATEIRNLSIQTKTNTASIAGFLKQLEDSAEGFFQANSKTKTVFSKLQSDIQTLSLSLYSIQSAMNDLTDKAMGVLNTMEGTA